MFSNGMTVSLDETWSNALTKPGFTKSLKQYSYISIKIMQSQLTIF